MMSVMSQPKLSGSDGGGGNDELLVFGYACKLFRDDEKAHMIDSGQHLIPWMGDDSLKIDRYDGRGALYDLASHEPTPNSYEQLTYDELETERLCDKERYRSLNKRQEEEAIYQEEEMKRFYQQTNAYGQVAYVYEEEARTVLPAEEGQIPDDAVPSKPFVLPTDLSVPPDITLPETMKLHAIIERTAMFISKQGPQMEIIMKLKQHGNKQFDFLSHNDSLHPYYKFLLTSIKSGTYTPSEEKSWTDDENQSEEHDEDDDTDGHYLHPSLASKPFVQTINPCPEELNSESEKTKKLENEIPSAHNPPEDIKKIVEKMIKYVARNGPAFETLIIKRCDDRFSFLNPSNIFYQYYQDRLKEAPKSEKWDPEKKEKSENKNINICPETENNDSNSSEKSLDKGLKRKPNPVCFSIKKAKENEGLEVPSALPLEDSSDDNEQDTTSPKNTDSNKIESSPESSDDSDLSLLNKDSSKPKKVESKKRKSYGKEKDVHIQKERKLKVAQFLKCLKNKH